VQLAIDDFGTGYSSLAYLSRFPIDMLKIDRSFITGLDANSDHQAIVAAIIELARALGMEAIAEGVETEAEAAVLRRLGCPRVQGFHYARPVPAEELTRLLRQRRPALSAGPAAGD
jgi:EAL domain-containing protein (putative c-di-GMP-specific phosphodiesterase class I)